MVYDLLTMITLFIVVPGVMSAGFVIAVWILNNGDDDK